MKIKQIISIMASFAVFSSYELYAMESGNNEGEILQQMRNFTCKGNLADSIELYDQQKGEINTLYDKAKAAIEKNNLLAVYEHHQQILSRLETARKMLDHIPYAENKHSKEVASLENMINMYWKECLAQRIVVIFLDYNPRTTQNS